MKKPETIRARKIAQQIQSEISWIIDRQMKNPGGGMITITQVKMTSDLKLASVYFTIFEQEPEQKKVVKDFLNNASAFIRHELRNKITTRFLPDIRFFYDDTFEQAQKINDLFAKIHEQDNKQ